MFLVSSTKSLIQNLRDFSWDALLEKVRSFCNSQIIQNPDMSTFFSNIIRSHRQKDFVTVEHHYHVDIFNIDIDYQLEKLNSGFSEQATECLILAMKVIKIRLRNKMEDSFHTYYMNVYIENEINKKITTYI